ncbi:Dual specificity protein kinase lkh1 [Zalerion maritima]|uniref:dual-specificity kinase n=1 Tax=Zalerion maritima TaxID=339359 RepID=A0AAD5RHR4_9PEZI|nr:Dual specificity protein kinase lkh1 [Zalerion maritima]
MSTPTTATATLAPQYNPQHYPHYPHHPSYQGGPPSSFRPTVGSNSLTSAARLPPPYPQHHLPPPVSHAYSSHPNTASTASSSAPRSDANYSPAMPASQAQGHNPDSSASKKRRRPDGVNWQDFYKNGLPKEIIVIDDTPEPEQAQTNSAPKRYHAAVVAPDVSAGPPVSKRRKRDSDVVSGAASNLHHETTHARHYPAPNLGTPHHHSPTTTASSSSGRNTSTAHVTATAPTSIGSSSSNSQYEYDVQPGQKRRRTTRQQANESRRQQAEAYSDGVPKYKTPTLPIRKCGDIKVRVAHDPYRNRNIKYDDDDGHYIVVPDADLTEDYQMIQLLGQGTFGKVVKARDKKRNKLVAVKIIRSVQKYRDASRIELRVLETLKANDATNRNRCIHLRDCFDYRNHICIVMDLLDQSVFDFLKGNHYVPFPNSQIQSFARQLFTSVAFLHDLNLIHTDLKPENILLCNSAYQTFTYNRKIPSSSTQNSRDASKRKVLLDTEIRLIDFGSATFNDEYHSSVVSTRHYRAPEIILGLGWSYECDIWSIGCILVEFFTGDALFQTHDNLEHLAMMEGVVGSRIDQPLVQQVNRTTRGQNNPATGYFKRFKLDYPTHDTSRASKKFVRGMKQLKQIIPANNSFLRNFLDLLEKIFVYDPKKRIKAKEALNHPWFSETAYPDDGTEAAKIKREREMVAPGTRSAPVHIVG